VRASLLALSLLGAPSAQAADAMFERLAQASQWIEDATGASTGAAGAIRLQLLPMDLPGYQQYVASAYSEPPSALGESALSAFYQHGGQIDSRRQNICFLLYNPKARRILDEQFVAPHHKAHAPSLAPYLFMAAHELGHCMEFKHSVGKPSAARHALRMEVRADSFAILALRQAGVPSEEIAAIVDSRQRGGATHGTWKWIQPALAMPLRLSSPQSGWAEEIWKQADKIGNTVQ
jgi:hypothetical protein